MLKICWSWGGAKGHIVGFGADPKDILESPKGTASALWKRPSENPGSDNRGCTVLGHET